MSPSLTPSRVRTDMENAETCLTSKTFRQALFSVIRLNVVMETLFESVNVVLNQDEDSQNSVEYSAVSLQYVIILIRFRSLVGERLDLVQRADQGVDGHDLVPRLNLWIEKLHVSALFYEFCDKWRSFGDCAQDRTPP